MSPRARRALLLVLPALLAAGAVPAAVHAGLDPESETFYHMARHFMTRDEEKLFRNLADAELRQEFIRAFWEIRDPDPGTEENEFRDEVEKRFEYVSHYLNEGNRPGWDTARGMVYLVLGPPSLGGDQYFPDRVAGQYSYIRWIYAETGSFFVQFVDTQGFGVYEIDMVNTPLFLMDLLEWGKNHLLTGKERNIAGRYLKFDARREGQQDVLRVILPARGLTFAEEEGRRFARLHVGCNLYLPDGAIASRSEERRLEADESALRSGRLEFTLALPLQKGANRVDLLIIDTISGKLNRRMFEIRKKTP